MTTESCWSKINANPLFRRCRDDVYAWRRVRRGHMMTHFWPHAVASSLVEGLTMWPAMYDRWPRSKGQGHVGLSSKNAITSERIVISTLNSVEIFIVGGNTWHTFWISRWSRPEVEVWWTFSISNAKINRKRLQTTEILFSSRKSGSRNRILRMRSENVARNRPKCCQITKIWSP